MDFGLKEIGITFMIGAFTILGFELVLHHLFGISITGFYRDRLGLTNTEKSEKDDDSIQTMRIAVFIGLSFGIGVLIEDLSYKYIDTVESLSIISLPTSIRNVLPLEVQNYSNKDKATTDSRIEALVKNIRGNLICKNGEWICKEDEKTKDLKMDFLANDLANRDAFTLTDSENGKKVQDWILTKKCIPESNDCNITFAEISNSVEKLYYFGKNQVYINDHYYEELKKIESRRDFSRSIALISFFYLFITFIFLPVAFIYAVCLENKLCLKRLIKIIIKWKLNKIQLKEAREIAERNEQNVERLCNQNIEVPFIFSLKKWINRSRKPIYTMLILSSVCFFSIWAFERELDEFHKRVFGYYSSTLLEEKKVDQKQLEFEKAKASLPK